MAFEAIGWFYLVVNVVFVLVVKAAGGVLPSYLRPLFHCGAGDLSVLFYHCRLTVSAGLAGLLHLKS